MAQAWEYTFMKPSGAGRAFQALGYRAKLCLLCDLGQRQRAAHAGFAGNLLELPAKQAGAAVGGKLQ